MRSLGWWSVAFVAIVVVGTLAVWAQDEPAPVAAGVDYVVERGDTLDGIAAAHNIATRCLIASNEIENPNRIYPGESLVIDADCPPYDGVDVVAVVRDEASSAVRAQAVTAQSGGESYRVQRGDTLDSIAQDFDVSVVSLVLENGLETQTIYIDDVLTIPADAPPYGAFPALAQPFTGSFQDAVKGQGGGIAALSAAGDGQVYVIQPRDTLDVLAASFDVDLQCLIKANELVTPNYIFPGMVLVIPSDCAPYRGFSAPRPINEAGLIGGGSGVRPRATATMPAPTQEVLTDEEADAIVTPAATIIPTQEVMLPEPTPEVTPALDLPDEIEGDDAEADEDDALG